MNAIDYDRAKFLLMLFAIGIKHSYKNKRLGPKDKFVFKLVTYRNGEQKPVVRERE